MNVPNACCTAATWSAERQSRPDVRCPISMIAPIGPVWRIERIEPADPIEQLEQIDPAEPIVRTEHFEPGCA